MLAAIRRFLAHPSAWRMVLEVVGLVLVVALASLALGTDRPAKARSDAAQRTPSAVR